MRCFRWSWGVAVLSAVALVAVPATWADDDDKKVTIEKRTEMESHQYEYYPEAEVYFVPEKKVYYWESDGSWRSAPEPPEGIMLGRKVILKESKADPWLEHEMIVEKHGGKHNRSKVIEKRTIEKEDD